MSLAQPLVQVPAIVSSVGAFFVIASWLLCKRWRSKVEAGKLILLIIGCADFIAAANYFNNNATETRTSCLTQAIIMQAFEIGSWNYNAVLAYEVYFLVTSSTAVLLRDKDRIYRHGVYHLIVVSFAIASISAGLAEGTLGAAGDWCWYNDSTYRIGFGYVPLWIGFAIIIACNSLVLKLAIASDNQQQARGRTTSGEKRTRLLFRAGVIRLLIVPFAFILLHMPGTLRRIMEAAAYEGGWYTWVGNIQAVCDPSQGTMTALLYLGFDNDLRREWWYVLQGRGKEYQNDSSTFSNSKPPSTNVSTVGALPNDPTDSRNNSYKTDRQSTSGERDKRNSLEARLSGFVGSIFRSSRMSHGGRQESINSPSSTHRFNEYVDADYFDEDGDPSMYSTGRDSSL